MATLTGQFISQSYGGVLHLSTDTGIVAGTSTQLQDGFGTNLGIFFNGSGSLSSSLDSVINGVSIGRGPGGIISNTRIGNAALAANTTGVENTAIGYLALTTNTSGNSNIAIGETTLRLNTVGSNNVAIAHSALLNNSVGINNIAIGANAMLNNTSGSNNIAIGEQAGLNITTGQQNTFIGDEAGRGITTGNSNTIIGNVIGLSGSLANNIILADGGGNKRLQFDNTGLFKLIGPTVSTSVSTPSTHKIQIEVNGTTYYLLATT
jgi:hypothetical protein